MKRSTFLVSMLALAVGACAGGGEGPQQTGKLTFALKASDSAGATYRLRSAKFRITGYPDAPGGWNVHDGGPRTPVDVVVSTEDDPQAEVITRRLLPGSYSVTLGGDWHLERTTAAGTERVAQVVLLSRPVQSVWLWDGGEQRVQYRFGVDGEEIDFRSADLSIGVDIVRPGERGGRWDAGW